MTGYQIAREALQGKPGNRQAVALVAGGEWFVHHAGLTFEAIIHVAPAQGGVIVKTYKDLKPDIMWPGGGLLNYPVHYLGAPLHYSGATTPALTGPAIESLAEVDGLSLKTVTGHPGMKTIIEAIHLTGAAIGRDCLLLPTQWGPLTTAARIRGLDQLMMDLIRDPEGVTRLMDFSTELIWNLAQAFSNHPGIPGFNISEPVASGNVISPKAFDTFVAPALARLIDRAKEAGKLTMLHICGNTTAILPRVAELNPDAFSLETAVDLAVARRVLGGKVAVVGNVSPTGNLLSGSPAQVREEGLACLKAWGKNPGLILANGCDIPKEVPQENLTELMSFQKA